MRGTETAFHVIACCALPGGPFPSVHRKEKGDRGRDREREQENRRCDRKHEHHVNSCMPVYSPLCDAVLLAGEQGQDGGEATLKGIRKLFGSREVSVDSICLYLLPA